MARLKAYREDSTMQSLARAVFDFSLDDKKRFEFLFETEGNLKLKWQLMFLKFHASRIVDAGIKVQTTCEGFQLNQYIST